MVGYTINYSEFQVLHGAERGEKAALLLSPLKPTFKGPSSVDITQNGSQFTLFLTAPVLAFCQMVGFSLSDSDMVNCRSFLSLLTLHALCSCGSYFSLL